MSASADVLRASYAACRQVCGRAGSNFRLALRLLPRPKRTAMIALYAFMRRTDDLVDNPEPSHLRSQALTHWRAALDHALVGAVEPPTALASAADQYQHQREPPDELLLPAVAETVRRYQIPPCHLRAVIDGVEMDLQCRRYETFDQLRVYCERVASAVGLACIHIWGYRSEEAFEPARFAGIALQLTNILRDLRDDAAEDRVYLPMEDLRACDYSVEDLLRGVADERFARLMAFEIDRAEDFYRRAMALWDLLEPDGRRVFGAMTAVYYALLRRIRRRPADVLHRRVRPGRMEKLRIGLRFALWPSRAAMLG